MSIDHYTDAKRQTEIKHNVDRFNELSLKSKGAVQAAAMRLILSPAVVASLHCALKATVPQTALGLLDIVAGLAMLHASRIEGVKHRDAAKEFLKVRARLVELIASARVKIPLLVLVYERNPNILRSLFSELSPALPIDSIVHEMAGNLIARLQAETMGFRYEDCE